MKEEKSMRSLIMGIIAVISSVLFGVVGFVLGIIAIILGGIDLGKNKKYALAGLLLGILAVVISIIILIIGMMFLYQAAQAPWYERLFG